MADVELLPPPEKSEIDRHLPTGVRVYGYTSEDMHAYARANVAHATAPLQAEVEALRAEVERANSWNERVSVCRDHVASIVDGPCVICALDAAEARANKLRAEVERLTFEMERLQQQYDERTACMIVHRGAALACSDSVRAAYYDEHHRAEWLAEALREERRRWGDRWWDRLEG